MERIKFNRGTLDVLSRDHRNLVGQEEEKSEHQEFLLTCCVVEFYPSLTGFVEFKTRSGLVFVM